MSDPKLLQIIKVFQTRLGVIDGTGDYYTKIGTMVVRGQKVFNPEEVPGCVVFCTPRTRTEEVGQRQRHLASVIIEGSASIQDNHPEDLGLQMLADIQRAVELEANTLGGLLTKGLSCIREEIFYPDSAGAVMRVQAEYEIPHIRRYGDPIN